MSACTLISEVTQQILMKVSICMSAVTIVVIFNFNTDQVNVLLKWNWIGNL
jgi:hypothetical protein